MNTEHPISEKEFELINILANGLSSNQRELAVNACISLGMANLLLKRLVTKGYLRVRQLNRRKVEHILTAKGFSEKARKSYNYTLKTLRSMTDVKHRIQNVVSALHAKGTRDFILIGSGDLGDLAEIAIRQMNRPDIRLDRLNAMPAPTPAAVILWTDDSTSIPVSNSDFRIIDLLIEIASQPMTHRSQERVRSQEPILLTGTRP